MDQFERVKLLLKEENFQKLQQARVAVIGVGGVGSYAAEALARSGIGSLVLVDKDEVAISNLNRQIHSMYSTLDQPKVEVMKERIQGYCCCEVITYNVFFDKEKKEMLEGCDFVIDAIDTISAKMDLIEVCHEMNIPCISSLGMANRLDPTQLIITTLDKTADDPLAKACRVMARKRGMNYKIKVVFSKEHPIKQNQMVNEDGVTRKDRIPPASMIFVPAASGLACAYEALRTLVE